MADEWRPASANDVEEFLGWRYEGRDAVYDLSPDRDEDQAEWFLDPSVHCHVRRDGYGVEAFCTFGADARVPGGDYSLEATDIGIGTRPDLVGAGSGVARTASLMVLADELFGPGLRRVTIAAWNDRAQNVARAVGFEETSRFRRGDGVEFVVLVSPRGAAGQSVQPSPGATTPFS